MIATIIETLEDYSVVRIGMVAYSKPAANAIETSTYEVHVEHANHPDIADIVSLLQGLAANKARARLVSSWPISSELYYSRFEVTILQ